MKKDCSYQRIVDYLRRRHNLSCGDAWPGLPVGSPAVSRYPNIAAELAASGKWLRTMAEFTNVSKEIMAAVLEDNEELSLMELWRLSQRMNVPYGYLTAPLQIVDPKTNKGKFRRWQLSDLMEQAKEFKQEIRGWWEIEKIRDALQDGSIVTYAAYHWAVMKLQEEIFRQEWAQHTPRSYRRSASNCAESLSIGD